MAEHSKLEAALIYASWGWPVLPVSPNSKLPAIKDWVNGASTDPEQIQKWWNAQPEYNIGIVTGHRSGLIVLDIDPRNGGDYSWQDWIDAHGVGDLRECPTQLTGRNGTHYLAQYTPELRSCEMAPGVDMLSDGRFFIAYPSHVDVQEGQGSGDYVWEASADPFDEDEPARPQAIPSNWIELIQTVRKKTTSISGPIIKGARNQALTSFAGSMRHAGASEAAILAALAVTNEERCEYPLPASELRQIAASVANYEPESDVLDAMSLGVIGAENILNQLAAGRTGFFLSRSSSFFKQPAPIPWTIKKWLPAGSTGMLFGESGVGKSFVAVDIACSIVTGRQWQGFKTQQGNVVYLAGEGNYGLRQRVVAWAKLNEHDCEEDFDRLLVSSEPLTLDDLGAPELVIREIHAITDEPVSVIFIDTLNRHMGGDENQQRDVRKLMNACGVVAAATGAAVVLVHHTGHGDKSGKSLRERGASAIRASLDVSILVSRESEKDPVINVSVVKMKDAPRPKPLNCRIQSVDLGWLDEDGEPEEKAGALVWESGDETAEDLGIDVSGLIDSSKKKKEKEPSGHRKLMFDTYMAVAGTKGRLTPDGLFDGVEIKIWRKAFAESVKNKKGEPLGYESARRIFNNEVDILKKQGHFDQVDDFYYPAGESAGEFSEQFAISLAALLLDVEVSEIEY